MNRHHSKTRHGRGVPLVSLADELVTREAHLRVLRDQLRMQRVKELEHLDSEIASEEALHEALMKEWQKKEDELAEAAENLKREQQRKETHASNKLDLLRGQIEDVASEHALKMAELQEAIKELETEQEALDHERDHLASELDSEMHHASQVLQPLMSEVQKLEGEAETLRQLNKFMQDQIQRI